MEQLCSGIHVTIILIYWQIVFFTLKDNSSDFLKEILVEALAMCPQKYAIIYK